MNPEKLLFLNLKTKPARVSYQEAAWLLGFALHDIPVVVAAKLLRPLGNPAKNGTKYFALADLEALKQDSAWLSRASKVVSARWKERNRTAERHDGDADGGSSTRPEPRGP